MQSSIVSYVGWLLLLGVAAFYIYGIGSAIYISWPQEPSTVTENLKFPEVISTTIASMQALLLTNLGIVLGITINNPNSAMARSILLNRTKADGTKSIPPPMSIKDKIQLFAVLLFVIALLACLVAWIRNDFSADAKHIVSIVPEAGKMFIGVTLAYLTAILSR